MGYVNRLTLIKVVVVEKEILDAIASRCGCNHPPIPIEYEIPPSSKIVNQPIKLKLPENKEYCECCDLKKKIICDYLSIIQDLECGKYSDLEILLEEISYIEMMNFINY